MNTHCLMGSDEPGLSPREQQMSFSHPKNNSESTLGLMGRKTIGLDGTGNSKCTFKLKPYNFLLSFLCYQPLIHEMHVKYLFSSMQLDSVASEGNFPCGQVINMNIEVLKI